MIDALLLTFVFLIAGIVSVPIAARLGLGSVLGYLLAGIIISPILSILNVDLDSIQSFGELGVVLMLFLVGLELDPKKLWAMKMRLLGLGGGQVALTAALIMGASMLLDQTWRISLAVGLILALSSTAIVLQTLGEKGLMRSDGGQSSFSVLLAQDIIVIPMLAFIPLLATPELLSALSHTATQTSAHGGSWNLLEGLATWQITLVTIGAIVTVVLGGSYLSSPVFRFIASAQLRELFTATALMFVIGTTLLMSIVGLSPALGTFLAGVVLANSPYRHELESDIAPFKGLLLGLFFMTVGAGIDFNLLSSHFTSIALMTLAVIVIKMVALLIMSVLFKIRGADKWLFALGLAQAGEFGFVLLSYTESNGVIPQALADKLLLVVALSMLLTPILFILYDRTLAPLYAKKKDPKPQGVGMPNDKKIIIAGSGRMGSLIDRMLSLAGYETTVIDYSTKQLRTLQRFGVNNYFGDVTRPELLLAAGIEEAQLLVVAIDDPEQISKLIKYVMVNFPHLHVISRAKDRHHVYDLWSYGCRDIVREVHDSSLRMGRSAFEALGISQESAEKMVDLYQQHDQDAMVAVADAHSIGIPADENSRYIEKVKAFLAASDPELKRQMQSYRDSK